MNHSVSLLIATQVFLGPIHMGSTNDFKGIWSIVHLLVVIARWGRTNYKAWFWSEVLSKY